MATSAGAVADADLDNNGVVGGTDLALFVASTAGATVTINQVLTTPGSSTELLPGDLIRISVTASHDGEAGLFGVFSSTTFDSSVLELVSACQSPTVCTNAFRGTLFVGIDDDGNPTSLARFGQNLLRQPGDPDGIVRTVQYGALDPIAPVAASNQLITVLTFRAIGAGITEIRSIIAAGDTGALGNATGTGSSVSIFVGGWIPEPNVALLLGLGLAGLSAEGRRR